MTAAEAAEIRDSLMRTSQHLHDDASNPNGVTHCRTCDCQFLRALDAVIAGDQSAANSLGDKVEKTYSEQDLDDAYADGHNDGADSMVEYKQEEIARLQAEIRELKTPTGYWSQDGDPLCYDDGEDGAPVETFEDFERWATQRLPDDGERIVARAYKHMPEQTYIVRWVPDAADPDMRRVQLERVEG